MDIDMNCLCRLCARKCDNMQSIFDDSSLESSEVFAPSSIVVNITGKLPLKIETVTSIKVLAGDGLPSQVCPECVTDLNSVLTFKEKCLTADSLLKQYLNSTRKKEQSELTEADQKIQEVINNIQDDTGIDLGSAGEEDTSEVADTPSNIEVKSEDGYTCPSCGKRYLLPSAWRKHMSSKHGMKMAEPPSKPIPKSCLCNICGKQVASVQFKQHIRSHEHNFQHLCTYCGKKYLTKFRLTQHIRVHTGEKPFVCNMCGKRFHEKSLLRSHQRRYLKQRPLQCRVCEKRFTNRSHLNTHFMIHTGEKPFSCTECGSEFRSNNHLKRHWKLHSGEKSYSCTVCEKAFIQKSNYIQHLAVHREEKPFKCSECGKGFSYKCSLKMHVEVHRKKQIANIIV
ncbi:hypothetical protein C0J52_05089 [Blattella germanica]|nr:hypothetical protein C0J52_05089 [Blattella germanica]